MRPQRCAAVRSLEKWELFRWGNPCGLSAPPTLRACRLSLPMGLRAHLRTSSITHLGLTERMSCRSWHRGGLETSQADDLAESAPTGTEFQSEADAEMVIVLAQAAKSIGLEWTPPPSPERSWLDDWFLGADPVPFFLEVHKELSKSWKAPFSPRTQYTSSSVLTTLRRESREGVYGGPPGGEGNCGASLARYLDAWLCLSNPSRWLLRTIRLGYVIQFTRRPPTFKDILFTLVRENAAVL